MHRKEQEWAALVPELSVTDLDVSLAFYELCGFNVRYRRTNPSFVYLDLGAAQIMLEESHDEQWVTETLQRPFGRGVNFQIEVDDAQAIAANLRKKKIELFRDVNDNWYETVGGIFEGQREFLVQDPDGYLIRFAQSLGSRKGRDR